MRMAASCPDHRHDGTGAGSSPTTMLIGKGGEAERTADAAAVAQAALRGWLGAARHGWADVA
jgi:hypothetical protein